MSTSINRSRVTLIQDARGETSNDHTFNLAPKEKMLISHLYKHYPQFLFSIINTMENLQHL